LVAKADFVECDPKTNTCEDVLGGRGTRCAKRSEKGFQKTLVGSEEKGIKKRYGTVLCSKGRKKRNFTGRGHKVGQARHKIGQTLGNLKKDHLPGKAGMLIDLNQRGRKPQLKLRMEPRSKRETHVNKT